MPHGVLDCVHARAVDADLGVVRPVLPVIAVLHHRRQPRRPSRELLDLDGLVQDDAVGAQPAPGAHREVEKGGVADVADVGLGVDDERHPLPGRHLPPRHVQERALGEGAVGEGTLPIARVPLAPEAVHHQVRELDEGVAVQLRRQQADELGEGAPELGMVVARLDAPRARPRAAPPQRDQGHLRLEEIGQGQAVGLELGVRELHAEGDAQVVPPRGVESQGPDGGEVETPRTALHVPPVAADVEHVDEGQGGQRLDRVLEPGRPPAHGQGGTVLLPRVADEAEAEVAEGRRRGGRGGDRVPARVLIDAEGALVEAVRHRRSGDRLLGGAGTQRGQEREGRARLQELATSRHALGHHGRGTTGRIRAEGCPASW